MFKKMKEYFELRKENKGLEKEIQIKCDIISTLKDIDQCICSGFASPSEEKELMDMRQELIERFEAFD